MDINFQCSDGRILSASNGLNIGWPVSMRTCPSGKLINQFRTQVEKKQGGGDDTSLNGMEVACIAKGAAIPPKYTCDEGVRSGASNCRVKAINLKYACIPGRSGCRYWIDTRYKGVFKKARKIGGRYVCDEGTRSGAQNCKVAHIDFKVREPNLCVKKQGKSVPRTWCTYWIDTRYRGVFKKARKRLDPGESPYRYHWFGTAPFCGGERSDCTKRGLQYVRSSKTESGASCWTGTKVLCRKAK